MAESELMRSVTWAEVAVILATGHPPDHADCVDCDARMYQVVTRVAWAVDVQEWYIGWDGFWNPIYQALQLARAIGCGCQFNCAVDAFFLEGEARNRSPEDDPTAGVRAKIDTTFVQFKGQLSCPHGPVQLELF